jgi:hypothetical protein
MKLTNEQEEITHRYDLDVTNDEEIFLMQMGLDLIKKDKAALINYAVLKILERQVKSLSDKMDKGIEKEIKKNRGKNGTKNNSNG